MWIPNHDYPWIVHGYGSLTHDRPDPQDEKNKVAAKPAKALLFVKKKVCIFI